MCGCSQMRDEQDGMMDGVEEMRNTVKAMLQRVDASLKEEADLVQVRVQSVYRFADLECRRSALRGDTECMDSRMKDVSRVQR
jgi:hypothetical protein